MLMTAPPKLKKQKKSPRLTPVYSGKRSLKFWNQINKIKGKEGSLVYIAGCLLQDVESRVLQLIDEVDEYDLILARSKRSGPFLRGGEKG